MSKYNVILSEYEDDDDSENVVHMETQVEADSVQIDHNCLKFFVNKKLYKAFGAGAWIYVTKID